MNGLDFHDGTSKFYYQGREFMMQVGSFYGRLEFYYE